MTLTIILMSMGCSALEMAQSWQLDRLRILAAKAEPAEPKPGDEVRFTSLIFTPEEQSFSFQCW